MVTGVSASGALEAAEAVRPELLPGNVRQAEFWAEVGRALVVSKKTRDKGVRVLLHAEQLAPQRIRRDLLVRETVADLLRQTRHEAGGESCVVWPGGWGSRRWSEPGLVCTIGAHIPCSAGSA